MSTKPGPFHDIFAPTFSSGTSRLAFDLQLDARDFSAPTTGRGYLLAQFWQGAPFGPPLSLDILPAASGTEEPRIELVVRNDETGGNSGARVIELPARRTRSLAPGRWYHIEISMKPDLQGKGQVSLVIDGVPEVDWTGSVGYDPGLTGTAIGFHSGAGETDRPNSHFAVYIGPYRDRMASEQSYFYRNVTFTPGERQ